MTVQLINFSLIVPADIVISPWETMEVGKSLFTPCSQPCTQDEVDDLVSQGYLLSPKDETNNAFFYKVDVECIRLD